MLFNKFDKALLILSTKAKKKNNEIILKLLTEKLGKELIDKYFIIKYTKDENSTRDFSKEFIGKYNKSIIFMAGGDGSISEVASTIYGKDSCLFVLPNGTGNDFSRYLYKGKSIQDIIEGLDNISVKDIDLIKVNDKICVNITSFGYDSVVLKKSLDVKNKYPKLKSLSFILGVLLTLHKIRPISYSYKLKGVDGTYTSGNSSYVLSAICNGRYFGGGFQPSPFGEVDDGILQYSMVKNPPFLRFLYLLPKYKAGKHENIKEISLFDVVSGEIFPDEGKKILGNIDGELEEFGSIKFEILRKALKLAYN